MDAVALLRVLHVEDDRVSALLMGQMLLLQPGVELRIAEDGADALAQLADGWRPDLLLLDAHLPDTSGHALLARLRGLPGLTHVPAVMCSADGLAEDLQRATDVGFVGYWVKPVSLAVVAATLRSIKPGSP
jgi:CheY-like chemotaxis protein